MFQCPICNTEDIEEKTTHCPTCGWDLTPYPLTFELPESFQKKEQARLVWAKEIWQQKQQISAELSQLKEIQPKQANISCQPKTSISNPTTWLPGNLNIYEFSIGFVNIQFSQIYRRWITGGIGEKIGQYNYPIPEKIKLAVNEDYFQINCNYPPTNNEVALIARDIDEYSILAVVTGEIDNKNLPIAAYRYFWTEKSHPDMDGIGSLLLWWFRNNQPRFLMNKDYTTKKLPNGLLYTSKYFEQYYSEIAEILQQSNSLPCLLTIKKTNTQILPTVTGCHCLALHLHDNKKQPISWAWNLHSLVNSNIFTVICGADDKAFENI